MSRDIKDEFFDNGMNTFVLTDEDGVDFEFELLDFVDYNNKLYAVLVPMETEGVEDFIQLLKSFGIIEIQRTGSIAMEK